MKHGARTTAVLAAAIALISVQRPDPVLAASITDVADAGDTLEIAGQEVDDPFDLYMGADFDFIWQNGKITREPIDFPGADTGCTEEDPRDCMPLDELRYKRGIQKTDLKLELGIFHDLAFTMDLPIYFGDTMKFRYAKDVTAMNSTIDRQTSDPNDTLFPHDFRSKHSGMGNLALGLRFAPLNDERDESKPSWVLFFKWGMPYTATAYDPAKKRATVSDPGTVGDGVHRLTFGMALSKRVGQFGLIGIDPNATRRGFLDPYLEAAYVLPIPQSGRAPRALVESGANPFGRPPSHLATVKAGFEIVPFEDLRAGRAVALDLAYHGTFHTEGRNYSELTDALGELTYTEQFLVNELYLGLNLQASDAIRFKLGFGAGYTTEHFLTYENVGEDANGDNQVVPSTSGNPSPDVANPYFCGNSSGDLCSTKGQYSYDQIGFRFKDEEHVTLRLVAGLLITL